MTDQLKLLQGPQAKATAKAGRPMGPTTEAESTTELKAEANAKTCRHKD